MLKAASLSETKLTLGAIHLGDGRTRFRVWAPDAERVELHETQPHDRLLAMAAAPDGYFEATVADTGPGTRYLYRLDGEVERPDPASRFQPQGVHGPSEVVSRDFAWGDGGWLAPLMADYVIYELHVGTFTPAGTFGALLDRLPYLKELGVNAIELMPVAQFPGDRNWGYDGVYPFAAQHSYGGPDGLRRLVDGCHREEIAVVLDVVYNHLGPEGNHISDYGPYFTDRYRTTWGEALNFDRRGSDEVRRFFIESAVYWLRELHIDAFRLDAVHAIVDHTAYPFLEELTDAVHAEAVALGRRVQVIAESSLNDPRMAQRKERGGWGMDAIWNDDFHHVVHTLLTGEHDGYYEDFGGQEMLVKALTEGFVYTGEYSRFRGRRHGRSSADLPAERLVVSIQNHDQVGNRMLGQRLAALVPFEALKLAAGLLLLSPYVPLLFMAEELGKAAPPFQYFVSHSDPDLIEAVRRGRREEFAAFAWQGEAPDPQDESTFLRAKLDLTLLDGGEPGALLAVYKQLIALRRDIPALKELNKQRMAVARPSDGVLSVHRWADGSGALVLLNPSPAPARIALTLPPGAWQKRFDSADALWRGPGSDLPEQLEGENAAIELAPYTAALFEQAGGAAGSRVGVPEPLID